MNRSTAIGERGSLSPGYSARQLRLIVPMLVVLVLGVVAALGVYREREMTVLSRAHADFNARAEGATGELVSRLRSYESLLFGARAIVSARYVARRIQWKEFVESLPLADRYPGVLGIGFAEPVRHASLAAFVAGVRAEGIPGYDVKPTGEPREFYYPVRYVEPMEANESVSGRDLAADPNTRAAAERSRDSGNPAITARTVVEKNGKSLPGFMLIVPVYRGGSDVGTAQARTRAFLGWVVAPIASEEMFAGLLGPSTNFLRFELYDGAERSKANLLFDSLGGRQEPRRPLFPGEALPITLDDRLWTLTFSSLPAFENQLDVNSKFVYGGLVLAGVLVFLVITGLAVNTTAIAERRAARMTQELRQNDTRLRRQNEFLDALRATRIGLLQAEASDQSLDIIVQRAAQLAGTAHGFLFQLEPSAGVMRLMAGSGLYAGREGERIEKGRDVVGTVWDTTVPLVVNDYPAWGGNTTQPDHGQPLALAAVPLCQGNAVIGVMGVGRFPGDEGTFDEEDVSRLTQLGELASLAIANLGLFRDVQAANASLERRVEDRTQQLRESEERYRGILEDIEDGVYELDLTGQVTLLNSAARRIFDLAEVDLAGMHPRRILHPSDRARVSRAFQTVANSGTPAAGIQFRIRRQNSEARDIEASVALKRAQDGTPVGFRGTVRDVSLRRRAEESQRQLSLYLAALNDTAVGLLAHTRLSDLLAEIINRAGNLIGTPHGYIYLVSADGNTMQMRVGTGVQSVFVGSSIQPGEGLAGQVWLSGKPLVVNDYLNWPGRLSGAGATLLRAVTGVPLTFGERIVGVLGLAHTDEHYRFGATEVDALARFASLASVALENARLLDQTQEALESSQRQALRLAAVNHIGQQVSRLTDADQIARTVFDKVSTVLDNRNFYIAYYDERRDLISFPVYTIDGKSVQRGTRRPGSGATEYILKTRAPLLLSSNASENLRKLGLTPGGRPSQSWLGVPMLVGDKAVGVICIQDYLRAEAFSPDDRELLVTIAAQAATALENARLLYQAEARTHELETINSLSQALTSSLDSASIAELVGERLRGIFDATVCYVALYDDRAQTFSYPYMIEDDERIEVPPMPIGEMTMASVITTCQPLFIRQVADSSTAGTPRAANARPEGTSQVAVPILVGNNPIGLLALENRRFADAFTESDLRLLGTIGATVGIAINNARLYEEQQSRARQERILREVTTRVRRAVDVETVLRTAAQEIGQALGRRVKVGLAEGGKRTTGEEPS